MNDWRGGMPGSRRALLDLGRRYETLLEHSNSIVGEVDGRGWFLYVGTSVEHLLGYTREALVGTCAFDYLTPADGAKVSDMLEALGRDGPGSERDVRIEFPHADGSRRIMAVRTSSYQCAGGDLIFVYNARDVSEEETLLERLRLAESRFRGMTRIPGVFVNFIGTDGRFTYVSPTMKRILGFDTERLFGMDPVTELVHPDERADAAERLAELLARPGREDRVRYRIRHVDGSWRDIEFFAASRRDHERRIMVTLGGRDMTDELAAFAACRESEERLQQARDATGLGLWDYDVAADAFSADEHCHRMLGFTRGDIEFVPGILATLLHPDDYQHAIRALLDHLKGRTLRFTEHLRLRDAIIGWRWVACSAQAVERDARGRALRLVGTQRDIHDEVLATERAEAMGHQLRLLLESTEEGICGLDADGRIRFLNRAAATMLGRDQSDLLGRSFETYVPRRAEWAAPDDGGLSPVTAALREGRHVGEVHDLFRRGVAGSFPAEYSVSPVTDPAADGGAVVIFRDESATRDLVERLTAQDQRDALTGLYNRRGLELHLNRLLQAVLDRGERHALCLLDLDQFRVLNSTCGHAAGDEFILQLSQILRDRLDSDDVLARVGGDEFAVLLKHHTLQRAADLAGALRRTVNAFEFTWEGRIFRFGASVGVVPIDPDSAGLADVLSAADAACLVAKEAGRNRVHMASPEDRAVPRRRDEMAWVSRTREAMTSDRLRLFTQPIVPVAPGSLLPPQREVLLRMVDDNGGLIPPGRFLVAAERHFLMPEVDRWVLRQLLARLVETSAAGELTRHAVNLSGTTLSEPELLTDIRRLIDEAGIDPGKLCFEITESSAVANMESTLRLMHDLGRLGCEFALDDFGSGTSSLVYLKRLPVDYVKLDGSFTRGLIDDPADHAIVEAVHQVARCIGIRTVAEHVETQAALDELAAIGIDYAQGFHCGRPAPIEGQVWSPPRATP